MLDTNTCIHLIKRTPGLQPQTRIQDCYISAIVQGELEYGVANSHESRQVQNRQALLDFLSAIKVLSVTEEVAQTYGELRCLLKKQAIGPNDLWIAAHAVSLEMELATSNTKEFKRVPSLRICDWLRQ